MFEDRKEAGRQLARALALYRDQNPLVLAIPRGGVEVGYQVARGLAADLALLVTRKLPYPHQPEAGFGAIAEDGSAFIYPDATRGLSQSTIQGIKANQKQEIERRIQVLRQGRPLPKIEGRTVILVDDGIAMGSTMRASIKLCRKRKAAQVVVGVPVAGRRTVNEISKLVDDVVVLETPPLFRAVAQVYRNWYDVPDEEVLAIMARWRREKPGGV